MKFFIALCLRRPVGTAAFYVLLMVLAGVAYVRLPVALLPELSYPALAVWTAYPNVPPERVERAVTESIEEALAGTEGLLGLTARSRLGGSLVELRFGWDADLDLALLNVREQLSRLGEVLPEAAERPVVLRMDPSEQPILLIALQRATPDSGRTFVRTGQEVIPSQESVSVQALVQLKELGREVIARRLEQLEGVARVRVTGGYERRVEVTLDPDRLAGYGLSIGEIGRALQETNVALPGGLIRRGPFRYAVEVSGEFRGVEDVAEAIVARRGAAPIRLSDVAVVRMSTEERRGLVRLDGRETLLLLVERTPDANTVRTAAAVREALEALRAEPPRVRLRVVVDESRFIEAAIGGVVQSVLWGGLLAILVLLLFLRRSRTLGAVAVAVPLSLGLTLVLFELFEVSFNLIALSGLALGVGMLVDNAIVVVENITRYREEGLAPMAAARQGAQEVAGAITASTLTTIAVFFPITFVEGLAGRLFRDQSLAVVGSLLASLLVALTVVPLIASRERRPASSLGREGGESNRSVAPARWFRGRMMDVYERGLRWSLDRRAVVLLGAAVLLVGAGLVAWQLPREVVPETDQGRLNLHLTLPPGAGLPLLSTRAAALEEHVLRQGLARHVLADLGERDEARLQLDPRPPYAADLTLLLPDSAESGAVAQKVRALPVPDRVAVEVTPAQTQLELLLTAGDADLLIDLTGVEQRPGEGVVDTLLAVLRSRPELADVRRAEAAEVPAYELAFRRQNMARFGVDPGAVAAYLEAAARGRRATALRTVGEQVPIVLQTQAVSSIEGLLERRIRTPGGRMPLKVFVEARRVQLPAALLREGQTPVVRLLADAAPGAGLMGAVRAVEETAAKVLPVGVRAEVGGANEAFRRSLRAVGLALLLSLLLMFLILAAEFENLLLPFVNLTTALLAAAGVAVVLWTTGQSVNLMSLTGCVVLVGIVDNNAVIQIDLINRRRAAGMELREAVVSGSRDRLRPILMTTTTTMLGLLPLALSFGAGAALRAPLAIAIVGGLASATVLTLFVVPVLYTLAVRGG